jgi:hypothetical protein
MGEKPGAQKRTDVEALRSRMLAIVAFIEEVQEFEAGRDLRRLIQAEAANGHLRVLRLLSREVDAMTNTLEPAQREALHAMLQRQLGIDLAPERAARARWADTIVARGSVRSARERMRLEHYLEELTATGADPHRVQTIASVLRSE